MVWRHGRRSKYLNLFKLALSLFYNSLSTDDVERLFSASEKQIRKERRSLSKVKTQEEMLLRNRARSFGVPNRHLGLETLDGQETELELVPGSSEVYHK